MDFSLTMSAAPHRLWYIDGDVVKVRVSLTCVPGAASGTQMEMAPLQRVPRHNYFSVDSTEAESRETDVRVRPLEVELLGLVELDTSVVKPINWPAAVSEEEIAVSPRPGRSRSAVIYTLYRTGKKTLQEDMHLKRYECAALEFVFRLPEGCPPTFKGRGTDYRHDITISATWYPVRSSASAKAAKPHICKVKVPLVVFNSVAAVAQLPLLSLFPLPPNSALVAEDFHFQASPLAAVPTPWLAAPLMDVMHPQQAQLRTSLTVRHDAKATMQSSLAAQRQPLSLMIPCGGVNVLQVHLHSSCVPLGEYLQGSLTVLQTRQRSCDSAAGPGAQRKQDTEAPVPVSVTATLELLECVTPECALATSDASVTDAKEHGMENFVCTHRRVIDHAEFCVLDTPCVPFEFSLPVGLVPASTITDITSFLWQLRVVVMVVPRKTLARTAAPGVGQLGPLLAPVAGVFPLLVMPPSVPFKVRQGAAC
ncbi:conserved hypothetical protein [Leishmania infantum JPCM5]|uniref:Uncharacterized protein n=4 Tax=Leishmania donovani species complex TaxID=38574 RepID=A4IAH0_LEIIN|nr:conserved hypothetical protein [Leishmania infantum JPCM5]XP_003864541.1 hypothetical protein, conserved [Leishmania donovani]CAC9541446.1 hypothetical_protein_-_conserved [Leishmania infantum]CAM71827.1 conserved hypothetical protein [Leishmania infantum JPCM5]CBZ37859.1 hypothetical protein, conserved [Leishmania donovani]SUZ45782.1 hypothetical_protein_-_conserved [Leishmania infantum]|eukprot:XP_001468739.1 conserved hypothetical protein [Leishmania infantum JPCM5]